MTSVAFFELVLVLVGAAVALSLLAEYLRLPPAAALVVGGMALAFVPQLPAVTLDPDLILVLFLPPLLLASAYETVWRDFRSNLTPILLLSVGAVAFTTLLVGVAAHLLMPRLPWAACFALGAIVSPPDAVAAKAVLQRLKLPRRLVTILEGESLVNDASGLVLYKFAVAAALTGQFSAARAGGTFVWLVLAGVGFGVGCGFAATAAMRRLHDGLSMIAISFIVAWLSYIGAERIGASGVLATVACGCVFGAKSHETFDANARIQASAVWAFVVFLLEAFVFVLIGLALRGVLARRGEAVLGELTLFAAGVTAVVVVSRFVWILVSTRVPNLIGRRGSLRQRLSWRRGPPAAVVLLIGWAGMRGVVTLAAALALPLDFPGRDAILIASFAVIVFTVLVQGTTLAPLVGRLTLRPPPPPTDGMAPASLLGMLDTRVFIYRAALVSLQALTAPDGTLLHPQLIEDYERRVRAVSRLRDEGVIPATVPTDHFTTALMAVTTSRRELIGLHRDRKIHDSTLRLLEDELDLEELRFRRLLGQLAG